MRDSASISEESPDTVSHQSIWKSVFVTKQSIMIMSGVYGRRSAASEAGCGEARERVMVPPHLYGQLAATR